MIWYCNITILLWHYGLYMIYVEYYLSLLLLVVKVHTRIMYLRHTIVSLARARGIENALLIFSHDHYDEQINELIQMIDFCKTMQIFYPYSIQTHPVSFPGESPEDCPRDITKSE